MYLYILRALKKTPVEDIIFILISIFTFKKIQATSNKLFLSLAIDRNF